MNTMESYQRAQDGLDAVLAAVPATEWGARSMCPQWTIGDVAGHLVWGQHQLRHWATGQPYGEKAGAPGASRPAVLLGPDPVATWRAARASARATLTDEALGRPVTLPGIGEIPVSAVVTLLVTDHLAHTWDIGHALGLPVSLDAELIPGSLEWARRNILRAPGFFGPALPPPPDADAQTRWLAYLGRAA